jgi:chemotaxis methyl-accepting protein methylase
MVRFGYLNLSDLSSYWIAAQDVIFCQNVLIYFKPESKLEIARYLCQRLVPGGYLFLAPVEAPGKRLPGVDLLDLPDALVYRKVK